jgi:hypothetical protein
VSCEAHLPAKLHPDRRHAAAFAAVKPHSHAIADVGIWGHV